MEKQKGLYPKNKEACLQQELFQHPTSEYRGAPFWSWNCKVTKELIEEQIKIFKAMGMGGVTIHARVGLDTEYMGEEFVELAAYANKICKEEGMYCLLYDEDNFPSGNAGGLVTKNHCGFRARRLLLTQKERDDFSKSRAEYEQKVKAGEEPAGYYITSYDTTLCGGYLTAYSRGEGKPWKLYLEVLPYTEEAPAYVDTMNREATEEFIRVTHEVYASRMGEEFGSSIQGIFTDEPTITGRNLLPYPEYEGDTTLGYTDDFSDTFEAAYGVSFLDILPEILWELPEGKTSFYRYAYNDHLTERFAEAYSDTLGEWCEKHGLASTGHLLSERTLFQQSYRLGEAMRHYRNYQIPGIDILCGDLEFSTAKQAVSVARQYGRDGVLSELYGVTNWDFDFKGHKLQGDWQAALGVTLRVHHLAYMSMEGEGKRDWPPSIFYQSPWYDKYGYIEDHFARVNTALTRGKACVRVAVIHPIESYWTVLGNNAQTGARRAQMDEEFEQFIRMMLYGVMDFDFICEALLPELYDDGKEGFGVGAMSYDTVVVPNLCTIRASTVKCLSNFVKKGGRVIFAGELPTLVDGKESVEAKALADECERIPFSNYHLMNALQSDRTVDIIKSSGDRSDKLFYQMREDGEAKWLFVCHVTKVENNADRQEQYEIKVKGCYHPRRYDTLTGEVSEAAASHENGWTVIPAVLYGEDSLLLFLTPGEPVIKPKERQDKVFQLVPIWTHVDDTFMELKRIASWRREEENVLLLDTASFSLDQREWNPKEDMLRIDKSIKAKLGYKTMQPYRSRAAQCNHRVGLRMEFESKISYEGAVLAMERAEPAEITLNGIKADAQTLPGFYVDRFIQKRALPPMQPGINVLEVVMPFGEKSRIEPMYLLGDFAVRLLGERALIEAQEPGLEAGDITRQGMPFYGGNLEYDYVFAVDKKKELLLEVPHFSAPLLEVFLDGQSCGLIAFAPHKISLGLVEEGGHQLKIKLYGNRHNTFGALHNADSGFRWYGPMSFRTEGSQWTQRYKIKEVGILSHPRLTCEDVEPY